VAPGSAPPEVILGSDPATAAPLPLEIALDDPRLALPTAAQALRTPVLAEGPYWRIYTVARPQGEVVEIDARVEERLRELGYIK
jgi:hypothetical protein